MADLITIDPELDEVLYSEHITLVKLFDTEEAAKEWYDQNAKEYRDRGYTVFGDERTDPMFDWVEPITETANGKFEAVFEADYTEWSSNEAPDQTEDLGA